VKKASSKYLQLRRQGRALALVTAGKADLPGPFYAFHLASAEALSHSCLSDLNSALLVLHSSRDELLGYLGTRSRTQLEGMRDVWEEAYSHTSRLVGWYRHAEAAAGAEMLVDWMVENGPYRSRFQLPRKFVRELPMNPWPSFGDFEFVRFDSVRAVLVGSKGALEAEVHGEKVRELLPISHDAECNLEIEGERDVREQVHATIERKERKGTEGEGEEEEGGEEEDRRESATEALGELKRRIERLGFKVHRLGYSTLSPRASTLSYYGESNLYLNLAMALPGGGGGGGGDEDGGDENSGDEDALASQRKSGCLAVTCHYQEVRSLPEKRPVVLYDDSFFTRVSNECDEALAFVWLEIYHPQFSVVEEEEGARKEAKEGEPVRERGAGEGKGEEGVAPAASKKAEL